jgi:phosphatidylserine decarboxylase
MVNDMATLERQPAAARVSTPIRFTQPGGGFCMSLELAWSRFRRAMLRRLRPGYVQRMAALRLGECPNCRHEIVDPRDLKYYRNVCGYYFRSEDDPFQWRDELGFARPGLAEIVLLSLLFLSITLFGVIAAGFIHWAFWSLVAVGLAGWAFVLYFFRDPERTIPADPRALVSPADGTITHIGEVDEPDFPGGRAFRIGIFLSIFSVHVNRIPRTGQVVGLRYFPGSFVDARRDESSSRNEQFWIDLEENNPPRRVRVKQIAGAVARRIVCWLKPGETVWAGAKLGMIKFGSRTEVYIPVGEQFEVLVKVGDAVKGGSTVLLRYSV